jgi:hypothetical protein
LFYKTTVQTAEAESKPLLTKSLAQNTSKSIKNPFENQKQATEIAAL